MADSERFARAVAQFELQNARDPRRVTVSDGSSQPLELVQARRLAATIAQLAPNASEPLRLAAHCQHLRRWEIPRSSFPSGRAGYLRWRRQLASFHADEATKVLHEVGYDDDLIRAVRRINLKQDLQESADGQTMEDALCLVFLEYEALEFAAHHDAKEVARILEMTFRKMSALGRAAAARLALPEALRNALPSSGSPPA